MGTKEGFIYSEYDDTYLSLQGTTLSFSKTMTNFDVKVSGQINVVGLPFSLAMEESEKIYNGDMVSVGEMTVNPLKQGLEFQITDPDKTQSIEGRTDSSESSSLDDPINEVTVRYNERYGNVITEFPVLEQRNYTGEIDIVEESPLRIEKPFMLKYKDFCLTNWENQALFLECTGKLKELQTFIFTEPITRITVGENPILLNRKKQYSDIEKLNNPRPILNRTPFSTLKPNEEEEKTSYHRSRIERKYPRIKDLDTTLNQEEADEIHKAARRTSVRVPIKSVDEVLFEKIPASKDVIRPHTVIKTEDPYTGKKGKMIVRNSKRGSHVMFMKDSMSLEPDFKRTGFRQVDPEVAMLMSRHM